MVSAAGFIVTVFTRIITSAAVKLNRNNIEWGMIMSAPCFAINLWSEDIYTVNIDFMLNCHVRSPFFLLSYHKGRKCSFSLFSKRCYDSVNNKGMKVIGC